MKGDIVDISSHNETDTHGMVDAFLESLRRPTDPKAGLIVKQSLIGEF
jgi:hypothetical protein